MGADQTKEKKNPVYTTDEVKGSMKAILTLCHFDSNLKDEQLMFIIQLIRSILINSEKYCYKTKDEDEIYLHKLKDILNNNSTGKYENAFDEIIVNVYTNLKYTKYYHHISFFSLDVCKTILEMHPSFIDNLIEEDILKKIDPDCSILKKAFKSNVRLIENFDPTEGEIEYALFTDSSLIGVVDQNEKNVLFALKHYNYRYHIVEELKDESLKYLPKANIDCLDQKQNICLGLIEHNYKSLKDYFEIEELLENDKEKDKNILLFIVHSLKLNKKCIKYMLPPRQYLLSNKFNNTLNLDVEDERKECLSESTINIIDRQRMELFKLYNSKMWKTDQFDMMLSHAIENLIIANDERNK